jgi:asparagine synthase (glutamine-hydrolysing)
MLGELPCAGDFHTTLDLELVPVDILLVSGQASSGSPSAGADLSLPTGPLDSSFAQALQCGPSAVALLDGNFAVALATSPQEVVMAVDRFGIETLCWRQDGDMLRVSDRADGVGGTEIDPQAIYDYLFFHVIPSPRTIFKGVQRLPAGHFGRFDGRAVEMQSFGRLHFQPRADIRFEDAKREFRHLLANAVQRQLEPGVPACFLSGGTDSSTVAGHIKQIAGEVHTYSIGFDAEGYDEMEYARIAARHFGARHHEYYVTPDDLVRSISEVAGAYDQPFGNSSALPAYYCALKARADGVTKLLAGDGGDELFGGNERYAKQKVYRHWGRAPWPLQALAAAVVNLPGADALAVLRKGRNYIRDARQGLPDRLCNYNLLLRLGPQDVLQSGFLASVHPQSVFQQMQQVWGLAQADSEIDRMLAYDWRYTLAESDLPKVRGTSSLAGVKVGYPMLDDALADFSMTLPEDYKVRGQTLRWFFKEALRDFLPEAIITKKKKGFGLPFGVWATRHAALNAMASDSLRSFGTRGVVRAEFISTLLTDLLPRHPGYYGEMVWILLMLEQWLRRHAPEWRATAS